MKMSRQRKSVHFLLAAGTGGTWSASFWCNTACVDGSRWLPISAWLFPTIQMMK